MTLCVHSHGGSYIENPDEIQRLLEMTDPSLVNLCFDTGHVAFGGGDPVDLAEKLAGRIGHVHLKDIRLELLREKLAQGKDYVAAAQGGCLCALRRG